MTFVVPFDGSDLSRTALVRAAKFGAVLEQRVVAVTVIPHENARYARERGWLEADEEFDLRNVVATLHEEITELAPAANFTHQVVDRYAPTGTIARYVRKIAEEEGATMVFIGSDNAGRVVTSVSSVGSAVASDRNYDVVIVRRAEPLEIDRIESTPVRERPSSE